MRQWSAVAIHAADRFHIPALKRKSNVIVLHGLARERAPQKKPLVLWWEILHVRCRHQKSRIASRICGRFHICENRKILNAFCLLHAVNRRNEKETNSQQAHTRGIWVATTLAPQSASNSSCWNKVCASMYQSMHFYQVPNVALYTVCTVASSVEFATRSNHCMHFVYIVRLAAHSISVWPRVCHLMHRAVRAAWLTDLR